MRRLLSLLHFSLSISTSLFYSIGSSRRSYGELAGVVDIDTKFNLPLVNATITQPTNVVTSPDGRYTYWTDVFTLLRRLDRATGQYIDLLTQGEAIGETLHGITIAGENLFFGYGRTLRSLSLTSTNFPQVISECPIIYTSTTNFTELQNPQVDLSSNSYFFSVWNNITSRSFVIRAQGTSPSAMNITTLVSGLGRGLSLPSLQYSASTVPKKLFYCDVNGQVGVVSLYADDSFNTTILRTFTTALAALTYDPLNNYLIVATLAGQLNGLSENGSSVTEGLLSISSPLIWNLAIDMSAPAAVRLVLAVVPTSAAGVSTLNLATINLPAVAKQTVQTTLLKSPWNSGVGSPSFLSADREYTYSLSGSGSASNVMQRELATDTQIMLVPGASSLAYDGSSLFWLQNYPASIYRAPATDTWANVTLYSSTSQEDSVSCMQGAQSIIYADNDMLLFFQSPVSRNPYVVYYFATQTCRRIPVPMSSYASFTTYDPLHELGFAIESSYGTAIATLWYFNFAGMKIALANWTNVGSLQFLDLDIDPARSLVFMLVLDCKGGCSRYQLWSWTYDGVPGAKWVLGAYQSQQTPAPSILIDSKANTCMFGTSDMWYTIDLASSSVSRLFQNVGTPGSLSVFPGGRVIFVTGGQLQSFLLKDVDPSGGHSTPTSLIFSLTTVQAELNGTRMWMGSYFFNQDASCVYWANGSQWYKTLLPQDEKLPPVKVWYSTNVISVIDWANHLAFSAQNQGVVYTSFDKDVLGGTWTSLGKAYLMYPHTLIVDSTRKSLYVISQTAVSSFSLANITDLPNVKPTVLYTIGSGYGKDAQLDEQQGFLYFRMINGYAGTMIKLDVVTMKSSVVTTALGFYQPAFALDTASQSILYTEQGPSVDETNGIRRFPLANLREVTTCAHYMPNLKMSFDAPTRQLSWQWNSYVKPSNFFQFVTATVSTSPLTPLVPRTVSVPAPSSLPSYLWNPNGWYVYSQNRVYFGSVSSTTVVDVWGYDTAAPSDPQIVIPRFCAEMYYSLPTIKVSQDRVAWVCQNKVQIMTVRPTLPYQITGFYLGLPSAKIVAWATRWDASNSLTDIYAVTTQGTVVRQKSASSQVVDFMLPLPCQRAVSVTLAGAYVYVGLNVTNSSSGCVNQIVQIPVEGGSLTVLTNVDWADNLQLAF